MGQNEMIFYIVAAGCMICLMIGIVDVYKRQYMIYLIINIAWKYQSFWKAMEQEYKNLHLKRG